jgi:hypothetical protein
MEGSGGSVQIITGPKTYESVGSGTLPPMKNNATEQICPVQSNTEAYGIIRTSLK